MEKDIESSSEGDSWVSWFCSLRGNEFFCEIEPHYIQDDFNLTGLSKQIPNFRQALRVILDSEPDDEPGDNAVKSTMMDQSAKNLYGLLHARYILTERGMDKMLDKYHQGVFGHCQRVYCNSQALLPIGLSDIPGEHMVKMYCPKCLEAYEPKSSRYHNVDGAFFGISFPHMLFMMHPTYRPPSPTEKYVPKLYGFKIHRSALKIQQKAAAEAKTRARMLE